MTFWADRKKRKIQEEIEKRTRENREIFSTLKLSRKDSNYIVASKASKPEPL